MSTNYYLVTSDVSERGVEVKVKKHIGKSTSYFIFQAQPEWLTVKECSKYLDMVLSRRDLFIDNGRYDTPHIEDEYGSHLSWNDLADVIAGSKVPMEVYEKYYKQHRGHFLDDGYLFSFSEFT